MQDKKLEFARELRKDSTEVEKKLWSYLRKKRFKNFKFRRQQIIGDYIVDFFCPGKKLIIELDGSQHNQSKDYDLKRTKWLNKKGYKVLRFWNNEINENKEGVLDTIYSAINNK